MARKIDRIWVRFGIATAAIIFFMMALLTTSLLLFWRIEYSNFYQRLPQDVRVEFDDLNDRGLKESPRAMQIYAEYWVGDPIKGEQFSLLLTLIAGLPLGLGASFWVSRLVTQPLGSMAETAKRVAVGDFTVRALPGHARGEMADMVRDFNRMIDSLETLERERSATVASLSHELRTPLTILSTRLHAICDDVIPVTKDELRGLLDQSLHLGRLVDDLHTISMAFANRLSLHYEPLDLAQFIDAELNTYASRLAEQGMELERRIPASLGDALVMVDPDRIRQILSNLLENSLRYAHAGKWVEVAVSSDDNNVSLHISDAGPGLPDAMRDNPFRRFPHPTGSHKDGSGLGLSIVQALVERQGGDVQCGVSQRGGARFSIHFPRYDTADNPLV